MADGCPLLSAAAAAGSGADCLAFLALLMFVAATPGVEFSPDPFAEEEDDLASRAPRLRSLITGFCFFVFFPRWPKKRPPVRLKDLGYHYTSVCSARPRSYCRLLGHILPAEMAAPRPLAPCMSEVTVALGSRTTMLHPEIKRHRGWWREILHKEVPRRQAERASAAAAGWQVGAACARMGTDAVLFSGVWFLRESDGFGWCLHWRSVDGDPCTCGPSLSRSTSLRCPSLSKSKGRLHVSLWEVLFVY